MSKEDVLEAIANMSVLELSELLKDFEEKFDVTAAAPAAVAVAAPADGGGGGGEEKTEFDVMLLGDGGKKIPVIKVVRGITGLGLKEAKAAVESTPHAILEGASKEDAEKAKAELEEAGASVELK